MALPASGPISMSMIRTELQNDGKTSDLRLSFLGSMSGSGANRTSGFTPINQSSLTKPSSPFPASISEWYSYDHVTNKACGNPLNLTLGAFYTYVRYEVTGVVGSTSTTQMTMPTNPGNTIKCHIYTGSYPFTNLGTLTGTPVFNGTFTNSGSQFYSFALASTSTILHVVAWDETVAVGNYLFAVSPSCGTTTTTTTLPPLVLTNGAVTCTGNSGSWISSFSGGSGTYVTAALDVFQSDVGSRLGGGAGSGNGRTIFLSPGATSYNWSGVGSGSWYVGVKDSVGVTDIEAISVNCTTTSTTTTTTTATYNVSVYASVQGNNSPGTARVYYRINGGSWILLGSRTNPVSSSCSDVLISGAPVSGVPSGATFEVGLTNTSDGNIQFSAGNGTQCSATSFVLCGRTTTFSQTISANTSIYATARYSSGFVAC
jgi:hypothetical protein